MKIGLDLQVLAQQRRTGIGNYAFNLARALLSLQTEHEWVLFVPDRSVIASVSEAISGIAASPLDRLEAPRNEKFVILPKKRIPFYDAHVKYAKIMREQKLDVLHGPANVLPLFFSPFPYPSPQGRGIPPPGGGRLGGGVKTVITIHDLAIYKHPEWFPRGQWFATKIVVPQSIRKADRIIVPSEATKKDLQELFHVPSSKIHVIPHGVEERFMKHETRNMKHVSRPYILFVGTLEPRKNLARLIEAYEGLPENIRKEYDLVLAGGPLHNSPFPSYLKRGVRGVKFLDYVPDEELPALYQNASLFVYPSLYEGFGLPVLEAMAAGVPAIVSQTIAGNFQFPISNFQTVDPYSVEEITAVMAKILTSPELARRMSADGIAAARNFTWEKTAQKTLEALTKG